MNLYENIKYYRKLRHITQTELANRIGYTNRSSITRLEQGQIDLPTSKIEKIASVLNVTPAELMGLPTDRKKGIKIPVFSKIPSGIPLEEISDIVEYEEITNETASDGQYFGLKIMDDTMAPKIYKDDIVLIKKQSDADTDDIAIVTVGKDDAICRIIKKTDGGIFLIPCNSAKLTPNFFTWDEVKAYPVTIIGVVVEIRRKLK